MARLHRLSVRITGRILGEPFTHALMQQPDLSLMDVFLLDKVQKRLPISAEDARALRARKLIEGRTPNIHVSAKVAQVMGEQAQHTLNKGLDSAYYRELVLQHLRNFTVCKREDLVKIAHATPACLVCFEADYFTCHRTYVARAARQLGGPTVTHLTAKTALPDLGFEQAA